jgi:ribose transport system substrate-binding protein
MIRRAVLALILCLPGMPSADGKPRPVIAVIPKGTTHEFWKSIHAGAVKASRARRVEILWKGPLKEDDREGQIAVVEDMIRRKVAGIVLAPLDEAALAAPVAAAVRAGIPVVVIDSGIKGSAHAAFVATDNEQGGRLAGEHLAKLLRGRGRVAMLRYQQGSASTELREKGFLAALAKHRGITVVSANQHGGATTETAYRAAENLLAPLKRADGLALDGLFCPNESTTFGMLRALQDAGLAGKVRFVGFDASPKLVEGLRLGHLDGLILQNPFRMGDLGVSVMADLLAGRKVPARVDTGVGLVTKANMDRPGMKELLVPDLSSWLD